MAVAPPVRALDFDELGALVRTRRIIAGVHLSLGK